MRFAKKLVAYVILLPLILAVLLVVGTILYFLDLPFKTERYKSVKITSNTEARANSQRAMK